MKGTWQTTDSGGGLVLAVLAVLVLIGSGAASAAVSALEVALIVAAAVIGLAVITVAGLLIWRVRQERPGAPIAARQASRIGPGERPVLSSGHKAALEPPRSEQHFHLHLDGADPQVIAAIMRHLGKERQ
jgi:hypothetical protein